MLYSSTSSVSRWSFIREVLAYSPKENTFAKNMQKNLIIPPNFVGKTSKSGKSSDKKHHAFINEVLRPLV
ncbi:unnamed protein product, partial [Rotaria sordida]